MTPKGWQRQSLGALATAYSGGTPSRAESCYFGGDIPWVKSGEVNARRIRKTEETITQQGLESSSAKWVPSGSVLVAMYGATAGKVARLEVRAAINQAILAVTALPHLASNDYLLYALEGAAPELLSRVQGSGQPNLSAGLIKSLEVLVPPLPEQRKIAAILSSVDEVIETTEGVIEQLQNLKRAMMQELLTRGLPGRHARFKQTEMGEIPDEWAIVDFGNLIANGPTNGIYKPASSIGSGTLLVGMTALDTDDCINPIDWAKSRRATLTADERTYYSLHKKDLLIRRVYARIDGVGRAVCVNEPPEPAVYESNMMRVRLDENVAVPAFYREYLDLDHVRARVEAASTLAAQASINNKTLRAIRVARPSVEEQIEVVCQLESMGRRLRTEREVLEGLCNLKSALMSVLLTGELRTTPEKDVA